MTIADRKPELEGLSNPTRSASQTSTAGARIFPVGLRGPRALCADRRRVWCADAVAHRVLAVTENGRIEKDIKLYDEPAGLAMAEDGSLVVAACWERRLYSIRKRGVELLADLKEVVDGRLNHLVAGPGGVFYVATSGGTRFDLSGPGTIVRVGREGAVACVMELGSGLFGLALSPSGRQLAASEPEASRIICFAIRPDGSLESSSYRELPGVTPLGLWAPGDQQLWVCSSARSSCILLDGTDVISEQAVGAGRRVTACIGNASGELVVASLDPPDKTRPAGEFEAGRLDALTPSRPDEMRKGRPAAPRHRVELLVSGLWFVENPRWHDGKLWFADITAHSVMTADMAGRTNVVAEFYDEPSGLGFLPDGTPLVVTMWSRKLYRLEAEGKVLHADLIDIPGHRLNDMVVDGRGRAYVGNTYPARHSAPPWWKPNPPYRPGLPDSIAIVNPDGGVRTAWQGIVRNPNGMAVTPDGRALIVSESHAGQLTKFGIEEDGGLAQPEVFAQMAPPNHPDGICLDEEGAVWAGTGSSPTGQFVRILPGGRVTDVITVPGHWAVACTLGGPERRTLFMLCVAAQLSTLRQQGGSKSRIHVATVEVPGTGWP